MVGILLTWEEKADTSSFARAGVRRAESQKDISIGRENLPLRELAALGLEKGPFLECPSGHSDPYMSCLWVLVLCALTSTIFYH